MILVAVAVCSVLVGFVTAFSLAITAAEADRRAYQELRRIHRAGNVRTVRGEILGCVCCEVAWPCATVAALEAEAR